MLAELHLAEDALALHSLFEDPESLVDIVFANKDLHRARLSNVIGGTDASRASLRVAKGLPSADRSTAGLCMITALYQSYWSSYDAREEICA